MRDRVARFRGTGSMRRTKATLIYRRTGNIRAVQLLLGHTKIERTVRYVGVEVDDAPEIAEKNRGLKYLGRAAVLWPSAHGQGVPGGTHAAQQSA